MRKPVPLIFPRRVPRYMYVSVDWTRNLWYYQVDRSGARKRNEILGVSDIFNYVILTLSSNRIIDSKMTWCPLSSPLYIWKNIWMVKWIPTLCDLKPRSWQSDQFICQMMHWQFILSIQCDVYDLEKVGSRFAEKVAQSAKVNLNIWQVK